MKILLIFDVPCPVEGREDLKGPAAVDLFPLTGDWRAIRELKEACAAFASARVLEAPRLVDAEVEAQRGRINAWSAGLGDRPVHGKSVKEWFLASDGGVSAWWFTLLSEKNTFKTDTFFRMAQLAAIDRLFESGEYDLCWVAVEGPEFRRAMAAMCRRRAVRFRRARPYKGGPLFIRKEIRRWVDRLGLAGNVAHALAKLAGVAWDAVRARRIMPPLCERRWEKAGVLFVSYYPLVDKAAALEGVFRNRYAGPLQDKLAALGRPVTWLFMYDRLEGWSYADALRLGRRFLERGESVFFLQEFLSWKVLAAALSGWIRQLAAYLHITGAFERGFLTEGFTVPEAREFLLPLWRQSFVGWVGMHGLLNYELYKNVFENFAGVLHCLYYAEMHAWEKALNAARAARSPRTRTIGFQHTALSPNYFSHFQDPSEVRRTGRPTDLPLPDHLACNGEVPCRLLATVPYPGQIQVEAVRHFHLRKAFQGLPPEKARPPVLLVAGTIELDGTLAMLHLLWAAYEKPEGFRVWFKAHPAMSAESIFRRFPRMPEDLGWEVKRDSIEDLLRAASIALMGTSSTSIDALAYGCRVIIPTMANSMFMNPLAGREDVYDKVHSPEELRGCLEAALRQDAAAGAAGRGRAFAATYWNLEESLKGWEEALR